METIIVILSILLGITIITLGVVFVVHIIISGRSNRELQRLVKAKDLEEFTTFAQPEEDEKEEEITTLDIEELDQVFNKRGE